MQITAPFIYLENHLLILYSDLSPYLDLLLQKHHYWIIRDELEGQMFGCGTIITVLGDIHSAVAGYQTSSVMHDINVKNSDVMPSWHHYCSDEHVWKCGVLIKSCPQHHRNLLFPDLFPVYSSHFWVKGEALWPAWGRVGETLGQHVNEHLCLNPG